MEELIGRITAAAGIDAATAKTCVGTILGFLKAEGPKAEVEKVMSATPGAAELASSGGYAGGGLMGLAGQLGEAGLGMEQMQTVGREVLAFAREKAGEDVVGEIVGSVPGLGQFT